MLIDVTQDDIDNGVSGSCGRCPISLAVRRVVPGMVVSVTPVYCRVGVSRFFLPLEARVFVAAFDGSEPVAPFSFDMPIPEPHHEEATQAPDMCSML